jgi:hypothetical protein
LATDRRRVQRAPACDLPLTTCPATPAEIGGPQPGDGIAPEPMFAVTHAITIDAPIERG